MSNNSKRNRRQEWHRTHHNHVDYLVRSLGTPDGLRALSEFFSNLIFAGAIILLFLSKHLFGDTSLRIAIALALSKAIFRVERHG